MVLSIPLGTLVFCDPCHCFAYPTTPFFQISQHCTNDEPEDKEPRPLYTVTVLAVCYYTPPSDPGLPQTPSHFRFVNVGFQEMKTRRIH